MVLEKEPARGEVEGEEGEYFDDLEPQGPPSPPSPAAAHGSPLVEGPSLAPPSATP